MQPEFTQKMKGLCEKITNDIVDLFKDDAVEAHLFGSIARGTNDALSDIDIWFTFEDADTPKIVEDRFARYEKVGEIVLWHEMQNNFPLDGIQTAIIYKIEGELIRVDYYLCPFSSSRVLQDSKILFEKKPVPIGDIIPETKRTRRDLSDRITFFICMCFNGIKKVVRGDESFIPFLTSSFQKSEDDIPALVGISQEPIFDMIREALTALGTVSNPEQKNAIDEIGSFLDRVEIYAMSPVERAKEFADKKFWEAGPEKGNDFLGVLQILQDDWGINDEDVLVGVVLHDTLEDTDTTAEELAQTFSPEVARLVEEVSHPKDYNAEQKKEYYEKLKHISWGGKMIKLADFALHLKKFIGAFTGENDLPRFTYNEYCVLIRDFLESCEDSPAKREVAELNERLDGYISKGVGLI